MPERIFYFRASQRNEFFSEFISEFMPIITLTSDLGLADYYVAMVKAKILSQNPDIEIIDITHSITPFDIGEASFVLKTMLKSFPKDTIHLVGVNSQAVDNIPHLGIKYQDQYILTADNGILSLIAEHHPELVVELNMKIESDILTFPMRDLYAPAAVYLASGGTLEVIGRRIENTSQRVLIKPSIGSDFIKGSIVYIDHYGNAISNIDSKLIKEVGKGRDFVIAFAHRGYDMNEIKKRYSDVPPGERLAIINSAGMLEIAINSGNASDLLGLQKEVAVMIVFQ